MNVPAAAVLLNETTSNVTNPNPTPKPHEITTSVTTPQHYDNTGPYNSLSQELQQFTHSRINAELKPGFDLMEVMLELLQWNEQDVEQMWVRPDDHVDQETYDDSTPDGLAISVQDVLRKVWQSCIQCSATAYAHPIGQNLVFRMCCPRYCDHLFIASVAQHTLYMCSTRTAACIYHTCFLDRKVGSNVMMSTESVYLWCKCSNDVILAFFMSLPLCLSQSAHVPMTF